MSDCGEGKMKVLAFEDGYDIEALLVSGSVDMAKINFLQHWNSNDFLNVIKQFSPEILLLDHFMPPTKGYDLLVALNDAVKRKEIQRPNKVVAMSSDQRANNKMLSIGADEGIIKFDLASLGLWP
jgi:response regulator of citrate/malate metabolism